MRAAAGGQIVSWVRLSFTSPSRSLERDRRQTYFLAIFNGRTKCVKLEDLLGDQYVEKACPLSLWDLDPVPNVPGHFLKP